MGHVRQRRRVRPLLSAALLAAAVTVVGSVAPVGATAPAPPLTPPTAGTAGAVVPGSLAGVQLAWILEASTRTPTDAEIVSHFSPWVRPTLDPNEIRPLLTGLGAAGPPQLTGVLASTTRSLRAEIAIGTGRVELLLLTGADGLLVQVIPATPGDAPSLGSWAAVDATLATLAPRTQLLVSVDEAATSDQPANHRSADRSHGGHGDHGDHDGHVRGDACEPVHAVDADTVRPIGSQFKLVVLGALAQDVTEGERTWDDPVTVDPRAVSFPTGFTQEEPGAALPASDLAGRMISISDNTAADLLLHHVGRGDVQRSQAHLGIADPARNRPFLTTRELFQLKLLGWPGLADLYTASPDWLQRLELEWLSLAPLAASEQAAGWTSARALDDIEWFASATDVCRVFGSLADLAEDPGNQPVAEALALSDGGLGLDRARFPTVWAKGGSELGLLALSYRVEAADGRVVTVVVNLSDPAGVIDEQAVTAPTLDLVRSAIDLALAQSTPAQS